MFSEDCKISNQLFSYWKFQIKIEQFIKKNIDK